MQNFIVRTFAVTLFAVGSLATFSARAPQQVSNSAAVTPGAGPQIPIPICASCGRGGNND